MTQWSEHFDAVPGYLDTATVGLPTRAGAGAVKDVVERWSAGRLDAAGFEESVTRARCAWASLNGVPAEQVAIGSTVSALVGQVASCLPVGAHVLCVQEDFTSVLFPFLAQQQRGVHVRLVPLQELATAVDGRTDLVAVSSVQSRTGEVADLAAVRAAATANGARLLVDTTQSCGWLPLDCSVFDYTVCAAYKWLLSPRGVAFMSVSPGALHELVPHSAGWYAGADIWTSIYGGPLRLAGDARRLDVSPAWFSWVGAAPALELLAGLDVAAARAHAVSMANRFLQGLGRAPTDSAIVTVDIPDASARLTAAGVRTAVRGGAVRASFHLYTGVDDVDMAVAALS